MDFESVAEKESERKRARAIEKGPQSVRTGERGNRAKENVCWRENVFELACRGANDNGGGARLNTCDKPKGSRRCRLPKYSARTLL